MLAGVLVQQQVQVQRFDAWQQAEEIHALWRAAGDYQRSTTLLERAMAWHRAQGHGISIGRATLTPALHAFGQLLRELGLVTREQGDAVRQGSMCCVIDKENHMTLLDLVQQRLHNQHLLGAPFARPDEVVHWFGAVQAQEYPGATWGIAQRMEGLTQTIIDQAFAEGAILRTHAMRPTWHFVTPADIRWLLKLTSPRVHAVNASYYRKLELDETVLTRSAAVLTNALQGGKHVTRNELATALEQAGVIRPADDRLRLTYLVMHAELEGLICSGAMRGKQHTYALLGERVPATRMLEREEALAELTRRYFSSHGPATINDFAWWSGLSTTDVRAGLELCKSQLEMARVDGQAYWSGPQIQTAPAASSIAHLLPAYDEYTIAYKDHTAILHRDYRELVVAAFGIVIVIDGQIVGAWKRVVEKNRVLPPSYQESCHPPQPISQNPSPSPTLHPPRKRA